MDQTVHLSKLYRAVTRRVKLGKGRKEIFQTGKASLQTKKTIQAADTETVLGKARIFQAHVKSLNLPLESTGRRKVLRELSRGQRAGL